LLASPAFGFVSASGIGRFFSDFTGNNVSDLRFCHDLASSVKPFDFLREHGRHRKSPFITAKDSFTKAQKNERTPRYFVGTSFLGQKMNCSVAENKSAVAFAVSRKQFSAQKDVNFQGARGNNRKNIYNSIIQV